MTWIKNEWLQEEGYGMSALSCVAEGEAVRSCVCLCSPCDDSCIDLAWNGCLVTIS